MSQDAKDTTCFLLEKEEEFFTIDLEDVLKCILFAEEGGILPELPSNWHNHIYSMYPDLSEPVEVEVEQ